MENLTSRNLPEDLHAALKERARKNRRCLNQEVIAECEAIPEGGADAGLRAASQARMEQTLGEVEELRKGLTHFMSAEEIDSAKADGRR